jgi:hypothetical protein
MLLGRRAVKEDFGALAVAPGTPQFVGRSLDCATVVGGQGPGLVVPGVRFTSEAGPSPGVQWNGKGFCGQPFKGVSGTNEGELPALLRVHFAPPAEAFGLDLLAFDGFPDAATVTLFAPDGKTVLASGSDVPLLSAASPVFFGCRAPGGVGRVEIGGRFPFTPAVARLEFGAGPP